MEKEVKVLVFFYNADLVFFFLLIHSQAVLKN